MTTPWTVPRTWTDGEVVGAVTGNIHWRDNLTHLKAPPYTEIVTAHTAAAVISATASTAIPITAGISANLTTYGGDVQICFQAAVTGTLIAVFNFEYNGTAYTDRPSGIISKRPTLANDNVSYNVWVTGLASGLYTFVPTWLQPNGNVIRIDASAYPLIFWVREG